MNEIMTVEDAAYLINQIDQVLDDLNAPPMDDGGTRLGTTSTIVAKQCLKKFQKILRHATVAL